MAAARTRLLLLQVFLNAFESTFELVLLSHAEIGANERPARSAEHQVRSAKPPRPDGIAHGKRERCRGCFLLCAGPVMREKIDGTAFCMRCGPYGLLVFPLS